MRKTGLLMLAAMGLAVLLASGLALAAPKGGNTITYIACKLVGSTSCQGTSEPDVIWGTESSDVIIPYAGNDKVYARGGDDEVRHSYRDDYIEGGLGADTLRGGFDRDTIYGNRPQTSDVDAADTADSARDLIDCAHIGSRKDSGPDKGFGELTDTVVDCSNRDDL